MKDYLEGTKYTEAEKGFITKLARYLYIRFGVGRKEGMGWSICNDEDRERAVQWSTGTYSDTIKPFIKQLIEDTQIEIKKAIIEKIQYTL